MLPFYTPVGSTHVVKVVPSMSVPCHHYLLYKGYYVIVGSFSQSTFVVVSRLS